MGRRRSEIVGKSPKINLSQSESLSAAYADGEMQSLQDKASEWSGVAASDAFAIDETNVFNDLGGAIKPFVDLSTNFYNRVYDDEEEWFRSIFAGSKKEDAIRNQYEFFVQRMGGPPLYSQRKGHPALIGRHRPFPVTHQAAERWLNHMQQALDVTPSIDPESKRKMMNFFRWRKYLMANIPKELMEEIQKLTITNEELAALSPELIDTPALDESEITEADEENDLYNAVIDSQLQKDTLQAEAKKAAQVQPSDIPQLINEGGEIVTAWATSRNRSLTEEEKACLIQALLSKTCNDPQDFDKILLGWNLRGDHNVRECQNLLDDFQEMMSVIIASHRDFSAKSDLFMEGVRSFVSKQVKPRNTEVSVIPVTKKPEGLSQEIGRPKEYNN